MVEFMLAALFSSAILAGCQSTGGSGTQQAISDVSLSTAVQARLTGDRTSNFARVNVDTEEGVVRLRGEVLSAQQRIRAEHLARQVDGVAKVDNHLRIQNQPTKTGKLSE